MGSTTVSLSSLKEKVLQQKSSSSQRHYSAMLSRLGDYIGTDELSREAIDAEFVGGFRCSLENAGLADSTVSQMLRCFRAVAKDIFGSEGREAFKEAFADVESVNAGGLAGIGLNEIRHLAESNLDGLDVLRKVRDVWMLSFYRKGISPNQLAECTEAIINDGLPQEKTICLRFSRDFGTSIGAFLNSLDEKAYLQALDAISYKLRLRTTLDGDSARRAWNKISRGFRAEVNDEETLRLRVADAVADVSPHWYVMRCIEMSPSDTAAEIRNYILSETETTFDTFTAPGPTGKQAKMEGNRLMARMLFFRCTAMSAQTIRKRLFDKAYVFTRSSTPVPAIIPEREMRVFMLLCNAGADTISYHFPEYESDAPADFTGRRATISDGTFAGYSCTAIGAGHDRYKIAVKILGIGNLTITTEIPAEFLQFDD